MYSKQIRTIFRVLGNALLDLAEMTEDSAEHLEMNGREYLIRIGDDAPDVGRETPIVTTNTAAQVFGDDNDASHRSTTWCTSSTSVAAIRVTPRVCPYERCSST